MQFKTDNVTIGIQNMNTIMTSRPKRMNQAKLRVSVMLPELGENRMGP